MIWTDLVRRDTFGRFGGIVIEGFESVFVRIFRGYTDMFVVVKIWLTNFDR